MKSILFILPALASAAVLVERQLGKGLGKSFSLAGSSKLEPEVRPTATRVLQRFGPLTLKGVR